MEKAPTKEDMELFGHQSLATDLLKAECAMKFNFTEFV